MRCIYVLIAVTTVVGCASDGTKQVAEPQSPPVAAAPATAVAATVAMEPVAQGDPEMSAEREGFLPPPGYQKKTKGSTTVYCRSDTPVGTRFANEYCYTEAELERMDASRANIRREVDRARRTCVGTGCGGS